MLTFTIPGPAVPKARARVGRRGAFTPAKTRAWQDEVSVLALELTRSVPLAPRKLSRPVWGPGEPVAVQIRFFYDRRTSTSTYPGRRHGDIENLSKSVLDAMTGIIYHDDSQVVCLIARKSWAKAETGARTEVTIQTYEEERQCHS